MCMMVALLKVVIAQSKQVTLSAIKRGKIRGLRGWQHRRKGRRAPHGK